MLTAGSMPVPTLSWMQELYPSRPSLFGNHAYSPTLLLEVPGTAVLLAVAGAKGQGVTLDAMLVAAQKVVPSHREREKKTLLPNQHVYKEQCRIARSNNVDATNYNATLIQQRWQTHPVRPTSI
jgi:hypothetical protein